MARSIDRGQWQPALELFPFGIDGELRKEDFPLLVDEVPEALASFVSFGRKNELGEGFFLGGDPRGSHLGQFTEVLPARPGPTPRM
jgi:hypothetical protein